jgi:RNA 2',3'-cyclic 3'-phosphodiesterase
MRLFVAVEMPARVKRIVAEAFAPWRLEFPRARWVPEENWHVTLKFLGSTYPRLVDWVHGAVEAVASEVTPFETRLTGVGAFPSPGRARVLWAGLDDESGRMAGIASSLDDALAREFRAEAREFRAHLTVARSEPPLRLPAGFGAAPLETEPFAIDRVVLFRSFLRRPAPRYEPLAAFRLGRSPTAPKR